MCYNAMNENEKLMLKHYPNVIKGIAAQISRYNGSNTISISLVDIFGMATFCFAFGNQIYNADKITTGKVIAEGIIGSVLIGSLIGLTVANMCNKHIQKKDNYFSPQTPVSLLPSSINQDTQAKLDALEALYRQHK